MPNLSPPDTELYKALASALAGHGVHGHFLALGAAVDAQVALHRVVPAGVVERMRSAQASGAEAALEEGVAIALEIIEKTGPLVQGIHLSAPHRRVDVALRVLREGGVRATA